MVKKCEQVLSKISFLIGLIYNYNACYHYVDGTRAHA